MNNVRQCKIWKRELERKIQTQTQRFVSRFKPLLYVPPSHRRISSTSTQDLPQRNFHQGITITTRSTQLLSLYINLYTRGGHLAKHKVKKRNTLGDHKDHKQFFSQKDSKNRFELNSSSVKKQSVLKNKIKKKTLEKNFKIDIENEEQNRFPKTLKTNKM